MHQFCLPVVSLQQFPKRKLPQLLTKGEVLELRADKLCILNFESEIDQRQKHMLHQVELTQVNQTDLRVERVGAELIVVEFATQADCKQGRPTI